MEEVISISVQKTAQSRISQVDFDNLKFGKDFSDHMFVMEYDGTGWNNPKIEPFGTFEVTPAMNVFHYGQAVFEGMKAFYVDEKTVNIFRPDIHHQRLNNSLARMCMPAVEQELFMQALEELVRIDFKWIPKEQGTALYIRPFMIAADDYIAAKPAKTYKFFVITSPVGAYYEEGFNPVKLTTPGEYIRAAKGGVGFAKSAGNYAASFLPAQKAQDEGFTQVIWLDAKEHKYVEEVGTMNIFFLIDGTLITPPLTGTILPGVTRRSIITLTKEWGMKVEERRISLDEVFEAAESGTLQEIFGAGTAAVVSPVGLIEHNGKTIEINNFETGELTKKLFKAVTDIQYGRTEDPFGWVHTVRL